MQRVFKVGDTIIYTSGMGKIIAEVKSIEHDGYISAVVLKGSTHTSYTVGSLNKWPADPFKLAPSTVDFIEELLNSLNTLEKKL